MEQSIQTLISADNHWALLAVLFAATAIAIWLEQKYKWASKISGAIITLAIALILVNLRVIPASAPVVDDIVWGYAVPMAIPLLLLNNWPCSVYFGDFPLDQIVLWAAVIMTIVSGCEYVVKNREVFSQ